MTTLRLNTARELKKITKNNIENIVSINGVDFNSMYPLLEVSNKHASYFKNNKYNNLYAPFIVSINS